MFRLCVEDNFSFSFVFKNKLVVIVTYVLSSLSDYIATGQKFITCGGHCLLRRQSSIAALVTWNLRGAADVQIVI